MFRKVLLAAGIAYASAFSATPALNGIRVKSVACGATMSADGVSRRDVLAGAAAAAVTALPLAASAEIEYPNVPYLGGSDKIDVNNANVRAYTKFPGMYPTIAGLIAKNGPFTDAGDVLKIDGLTDAQKEVLYKYKDNLVAFPPAPEYVEDIFNNGLYR